MTIETHRFANDTQTRKRLMVPESFQHPAKGQLGMWALMLERYSQPGDLVLDPMAGSGATLLAALMGRNVICVELEQHFVEPMRRSWEKMRTMPMLGFEMGQAVILRGDARCLPLPDASVGAAITSPPYEGTNDEDRRYGGIKDPSANKSGSIGRMALRYTRPVDAIVTSPPFQTTEPWQDKSFEMHDGRKEPRRYTIAYDANKPPYDHRGIGEGVTERATSYNIGNLRNAAYWDAMRQVYAECWRVLKPGGSMALVLKGFTREGKYVDLPGQTETLLLEAGWQKHDEWRRELWSLSFWRILQKRRDPAAWDDRLMYESVLAFRKPEGQGNGVDTVITSPPYANRLADTFTDDDPQRMSYSMGLKHLANNGVDTVITSPPYEGSAAEGPSGIDWTKQADGRKKQEPHGVGSHPWGYTRKEQP